MSHAPIGRHRLPAVFLSVGLIAGVGALPAANAVAPASGTGSVASVGAVAQATVAPSGISRSDNRVGCERNSRVMGVGMHDGQRVVDAKVRVLGPQTVGGETTYTKVLATSGRMRTNSLGGFTFVARCLPPTFVVELTGGSAGSSILPGHMSAVGLRQEKSVVVTPATTLAVEYLMLHPRLSARQAVKRVSQHLALATWGSRVNHLGMVTSSTSRTFHAGDYLAHARKSGSAHAFAQKEAKRITKTSRRSFAPVDYQQPKRPGYPSHQRKHAEGTTSGRAGNPIISILTSVAGKALYSAMCAEFPPNPVTNLACANPDASFDNEVENQIAGITQQLSELNTTVSDMATTLTQMQQTLVSIADSIDQLQQQGSQASYVSDANSAQLAYANAYNNSGLVAVQGLVQEAYEDLLILSAVTPTTSTWTPSSSPEPTNAEVCGTMYTSTQTASGDSPLSICLDLLKQTDAFVDPSKAYYESLYEALVGGPGVPQDDLLIYTYQQMLTMGGHLPLSAATLAGIQGTFAQIGSIVDSAYALAGSAQMFRESATTGVQPSCPDLPTSGTLPASTAINVADACRILASGLFVGAVQNAVAGDIVVPPSGTLADPSSNYVWWGYPVDLSVTTMANSSFPLYPGASASTYTTTPMPLFNYVGMPSVTVATPQQLLAGETAYKFALADEAQNLTLVGDILLAEPSVAGTLAAQGFVGMGTQNGGMTWSHLGADPGVYATISTKNMWQSSQPMASNVLGCTGFPASITNIFECSHTGYAFASPNPETLYGESLLEAVFASHSWDLTTGTVPTSANAQACTNIGSDWLTSVNPLYACWTNTFGLLVDTAAATGAAGSNFWTTSMLVGAPSGGVAVIPVPQTLVTAG